MTGPISPAAAGARYDHVYLGQGHERNERRTWWVIGLCTVMMVVEIAGGLFYGSIALVADGLHMSTHAGALLLAALAYTYARRHARDARFSFGTGKLGDLAGFTSAVVLAMVALLVGYDSISRLFEPVPIHFGEAIPIAVLGLLVNLASVALLGGVHHGHSHGHGHAHDHVHPEGHHAHDHDHHDHHHHHHHHDDDHGRHHDDHNMRAAFVHVMADAAVSVLVILGLLLGRFFGWLWMDPVAGIIGALVIASWSVGLIRDTGAILLDMTPDARLLDAVRREVEGHGDHVADLHLWRLGPGHLGAIVSLETAGDRDAAFYRGRLAGLPSVSHLTVEVLRIG